MSDGEASTTLIINKSQFFALSQGAVITTPVQITLEQYRSPQFKPGNTLEFYVLEEGSTVSCNILDIESLRKESGNYVNVRVTICKSP